VTDEQTRPLEPHCRAVIVDGLLLDGEHRRVADFLRDYPDQRVCLSGREVPGIAFLKYYPFVKHLRIDLWALHDFSGIESLADELEILELGQKKSTSLSLQFLGQCRKLKRLQVEGEHADFSVIKRLTQLEDLKLRSVPLPNLKELEALTGLKRLHIGLGGTKNLSSLPDIGALKELGLWKVSGLSDVSMISRIESLSSLSLRELKQVTRLPSFESLQKLRDLDLYCMKGLRDLSPVTQARNLEVLFVTNCNQFSAEDFQPLTGLPKLKHGIIGVGSLRRNEAITTMLQLETPKPQFA